MLSVKNDQFHMNRLAIQDDTHNVSLERWTIFINSGPPGLAGRILKEDKQMTSHARSLTAEDRRFKPSPKLLPRF